MQQVSKVILFFYEKANLPLERSECANPPSKKKILYQRVAYKIFLTPVSLDNNFFDTQNFKIFSCVNLWTFKMLVLLAF
jgi:hypothetical protein